MILDHIYKIENKKYNLIPIEVYAMIMSHHNLLCSIYNKRVKFPPTWQWEFTVEKSPDNYNGSFIKRYRKLWHKNNTILSDHDIAAIAKYLDVKRSSIDIIKFTKNDWQAGDFKDNGSCFWGCRDTAPRIIKDAGGVACQLLPNLGRCWMLPFRQGYLIFNAYGKNLLYFSQIICSILGLQSIEPNVDIIYEEPLYINNNKLFYLTKNGNKLRKDINLNYISSNAINNGIINWCNYCDKYHFGACNVDSEE